MMYETKNRHNSFWSYAGFSFILIDTYFFNPRLRSKGSILGSLPRKLT